MDAVEAVILFIRRVVVKEKIERYIEFVRNKKNQKKFLACLDHALASEIYTSEAGEAFVNKEWTVNGFLYTSDGTFGAELGNLRDGYNKASPYGGWLILSQSGRLAVFRSEGRIDQEFYFRF